MIIKDVKPFTDNKKLYTFLVSMNEPVPFGKELPSDIANGSEAIIMENGECFRYKREELYFPNWSVLRGVAETWIPVDGDIVSIRMMYSRETDTDRVIKCFYFPKVAGSTKAQLTEQIASALAGASPETDGMLNAYTVSSNGKAEIARATIFLNSINDELTEAKFGIIETMSGEIQLPQKKANWYEYSNELDGSVYKLPIQMLSLNGQMGRYNVSTLYFTEVSMPVQDKGAFD